MEIACDSALKNRRYDADGRLHILRTPISKATVNPYYGREIPGSEQLGLEPERVYYLLRDPGELAKAAPSFARNQLMFVHTAVSAEDPKQDSIAGTIGSDVEFQAPYLIADLCIWDVEAIAGVETDTVRELSASYCYRADMTPGMYESQRYDGVMRDIQGNHVALVKAGRAGSDVMAADKAIEIFALDEFKESKHPRAENGEFGSGGGTGGGGSADHPFIKSFLSEHKSLADQKSYLEKVPHEKLLTAHKLASKSDSTESQKVKKLIEKELDSRAERGTGKGFGEDHQLETKMTETKFGKALYAILCAASPKLAADSALKPLVIGLTRKQCDLRALEPKLLAMDAELRKPETLAAMQAAKDAESEEETEAEKKAREEKEKAAKDKKAKDGEEETLEEKKKRYEREKRRADDSEEETEEERKERMEKRKAADKKAKDCSAKDSEEEEKKKAEDGMKKAMDEFKADLRSADEARRAVRPVVGDVLAQDSAADIYGFALDQMKVDRAGVEGVPALRALFNLAQQASKPAPRVAFDAVSVEEKFTGAGRQIQVM